MHKFNHRFIFNSFFLTGTPSWTIKNPSIPLDFNAMWMVDFSTHSTLLKYWSSVTGNLSAKTSIHRIIPHQRIQFLPDKHPQVRWWTPHHMCWDSWWRQSEIWGKMSAKVLCLKEKICQLDLLYYLIFPCSRCASQPWPMHLKHNLSPLRQRERESQVKALVLVKLKISLILSLTSFLLKLGEFSRFQLIKLEIKEHPGKRFLGGWNVGFLEWIVEKSMASQKSKVRWFITRGNNRIMLQHSYLAPY